MKKMHASLIGIMAGSAVAAFYGCGDESASSSGSDELLSAEDGILALHASSQAAQEAAQACFDTFKTCDASAAAGDTTCREQLKACLPDAPPAPSGCGNHGDGDASADAGVLPTPVVGDAGRGGRGQGPGAPDGGPGHGADAATHGGPGQGFGQGFGQGGPGRGGDAHGMCGGRFDFPVGALGGCRDDAERSMQHGMGCDGARAQHRSCMDNSFDESLGKLCKKAAELCAQPDADADICSRITSACAALPASDAGTFPTRPDAGPRADAGPRPTRPDAGPRPTRPDAGN